MADVNQEISEDYDPDDVIPNDEGDIDDGILVIENDADEVDALEEEVRQLIDATTAIESFGINPTAFAVMQTTGLLDGTSLNVLAMESFRNVKPEDAESEMALEAITDKLKERVATWAAKIISFVKSMGDRTAGILNKITNAVSERSRFLTDNVWNAAKVSGATIKAHPFKTLAAVLAAAAAVGAIAATIASVSPGTYANETALQSFVYKVQDMIRNIRWPLGTIDVTATNNGTKLLVSMENITAATAETGTAASMGWTQSAVKSITGQLNRVWSALKASVSTAGTKVVAVAKHINDTGGDMATHVGTKVHATTGSKLTGWAATEGVKKVYLAALWALVGVLYKLLTSIVLKAFRMTASTFQNLKKVAIPA